jgi:CubicO group peptidase (beta-lactamase class C family)
MRRMLDVTPFPGERRTRSRSTEGEDCESRNPKSEFRKKSESRNPNTQDALSSPPFPRPAPSHGAPSPRPAPPMGERGDRAPLLAIGRRRFLAACGLSLFAPTALFRAAEGKAAPVPLASFDQEMEDFMAARKVPGGALAVVKEGRLVHAKGYGWADRENKAPAKPDTRFRIASLSKPITATAVLKLVEAKKLSLDAKAFEAAGLLPAAREPSLADARLQDITVRQLLQHTAGWDSAKSGDPMFRWGAVAREFRVREDPNPGDIIRYMLKRTLDFDPGSRYAYSNFGYCVLGRVIEAISGQHYEAFVQNQLLKPLGIKRMRIGATLVATEGEAHYYTADEAKVRGVFPHLTEPVPMPYGGFSLEVMDAHGGWLASAVDLARWAAAFESPSLRPLKPETFQTLAAPPPAPVARNKEGAVEPAYYGCGWMVRPIGRQGRANFWHTGSLPGTCSLLVRRWDGLSWVALFNQRSEDRKLSDMEIDPALHRAAAKVRSWPTEDLFPRYF